MKPDSKNKTSEYQRGYGVGYYAGKRLVIEKRVIVGTYTMVPGEEMIRFAHWLRLKLKENQSWDMGKSTVEIFQQFKDDIEFQKRWDRQENNK